MMKDQCLAEMGSVSTMDAEQLEDLASGRPPSFMGMDYEEAIKSLARRVIAAEDIDKAFTEYDKEPSQVAYNAIRRALTAYREASK